MLRPISSGQARYYLEGPVAGWWVGGGAATLGLAGPVPDAALYDVLGGRQPGGEALLARIPRNRRSGFDLIVAAPKSVSLLAAMADPVAQARFSQAHEQAVRSTLGYLERNAAWTRRGDVRVATTGLVAAAFPHDQSGTGDPHLHHHVVVANLVRGGDGKWSALDSRALFRHARAASAVYQATLRFHLPEQGLHFGWMVRPSGLGDIRGVPRAAIDAASERHHQVVEELASGWSDGARARATVAGVTRRESAAGVTRREPAGGVTPREPAAGVTPREPAAAGRERWIGRVAATGFDRGAAERLIAQALSRTPAAPPPGPSEQAISEYLTAQHSRFHRADAVRAVAVLSVDGASAPYLEASADRFLQHAVTVEPGTWTTPQLRQMEGRIVAIADGLAVGDRTGGRESPITQAGPNGPITPTGPNGPIAQVRPDVPIAQVRPDVPIPGGLRPPAAQAVARLTGDGAPIALVQGPFLSQAEVLDAARSRWEAGGYRVSLVARTDRAQERWRALAGLDGRPFSPSSPAVPARANVLLIDSADRWPTADLHRIVSDAAIRQAKVVLLEGGSERRLRRPESPAMAVLRGKLSVIDAGPSPPYFPAGLDRSGAAISEPAVQGGRDGAVTVAPSAPVAVDRIVTDWMRLRAAGARPRMVALGREEVDVLNNRARAALAAGGALRGPVVEIGGRSFQAGDDVVALRRDRRLGVAAGGVGQVSAVDPQNQAVIVRWRDREDPVVVAATKAPPALAHGYATTPAYLRHGYDGALLSLGDVEPLVPRLHPERVYAVMPRPSPPSVLRRDDPGPMAALVAEVAGGGTRSSSPHDDRTPPAVARPLSQLMAERAQAADRLTAEAPLDPRPAIRRLEEERAWLLADPRRPGQVSSLAEVDRRRAALDEALGGRRDWLTAHGDELRNWAELSQAICWREAALGRAAELRPSVAVQSLIGTPPPAGGAGRAEWRTAAEAIEVHRDRWALPDGPLNLEPGRGLVADVVATTPQRETERRMSQQRVLTTTRQFQLAVDRSRHLDRGVDLGL